MKRISDLIFAVFGLVLFFIPFLVIALLIKLNSKGPIFFRQIRVGRNNKDFKIFKFRTMYLDSYKKSLITIGERDSRVTNVGFYLRKYKLDELPQLLNVFFGDMSFVGPRPEVRYYVNFYTEAQKEVLNVRPGITDVASIEFRNENELLEKQQNPQKYYLDVIMQEKIRINLEYLENRNILKDFLVVLKTFKVILKK
jgi:lipopolysaccharide/colanic/teichoic acid biosynthesis glycosyltransferase